jgi:serine/threonine-protein kinase
MSEAHLRLVEDRAPSIPPPDPLVGRTLDGRYRIEAVLGEGGMGLVYRARHAGLNKALAIKVLRPEVSRDAEVMSRFQQEAQSASAIGNHHIIDISDFGALPDGSTYFVMEFLDGIALTTAIEEQQPIPAARVIKVARQLCDALGAAHERNIVHRDLKPDNIYLVKRGSDTDFVKVLDFGIAKVGGSSSKLTKAGQVFGTPHYMSPEQCAGANVDARTDIYALGVILYEMSTGRVPFDADNLMGILTKHIYERPVAPRDLPSAPGLPPGLEAVIMKCLTKSADARYQTMAEMRADLDRLESGALPRAVTETGRTVLPRDSLSDTSGGTRRSPALVATAALAVLGIVGGGGYIAYASMQRPPGTESDRPTGGASGSSGTGTGGTGGATATGGEGAAGAGAGAGAAEGTGAGGADPSAVVQGADVRPTAPPIRLETTPPGADVVMDGAVLGVTPMEVPRPSAGGFTTITLRLRGYRDETIGLLETTPLLVSRDLTRVGGARRTDGASMEEVAPPHAPTMEVMLEVTMETTMATGRTSGSDGLVDPWQ